MFRMNDANDAFCITANKCKLNKRVCNFGTEAMSPPGATDYDGKFCIAFEPGTVSTNRRPTCDVALDFNAYRCEGLWVKRLDPLVLGLAWNVQVALHLDIELNIRERASIGRLWLSQEKTVAVYREKIGHGVFRRLT